MSINKVTDLDEHKRLSKLRQIEGAEEQAPWFCECGCAQFLVLESCYQCVGCYEVFTFDDVHGDIDG